MVTFLGFSAFWVLVFGILQWARGGDGIWRLFKVQRQLQREGGSLGWREEERAKREIQRLESATDRMLRASFKAVGFLALCAWIAVGVTFLLDAFGIEWVHHVTSRASIYWRAEVGGVHRTAASARNDMLRNIGLNMKK